MTQINYVFQKEVASSYSGLLRGHNPKMSAGKNEDGNQNNSKLCIKTNLK